MEIEEERRPLWRNRNDHYLLAIVQVGGAGADSEADKHSLVETI